MPDTTLLKFRYEYHYVNGLMLHVGHMGPVTGDKIIFLHGFPEFSGSWVRQAEYFARQGYHVIAPDQRGYNLSRKPPFIGDYTLTHLVNDMAALARLLAPGAVFVVGHDWGGGVAWTLAQRHPELVRKLIILNMPHPDVMRENLRKNPLQMLRSTYAMFFQLPFLPERLCRAFNFRLLQMSMVKTARAGTFPRAYLAACKQAWRQPNALTSMINWYRAFFQRYVPVNQPIEVPTLIIWGMKDLFLSGRMAEQSVGRCSDGRLIRLANATHWLHHEEPALVNQYISEFIQSS